MIGQTRIQLVLMMLMVCAFLVGSQLALKTHFLRFHVTLNSPACIPQMIWQAIKSPWAWVALATMMVAGIIWITVLQSAPLSVAYPMASLSYVLMLLAAYWVYDEPITLLKLFGVALIIAGVVFLSR
jgi:multidrug transporter EmrE-like cation transporter